MTLLINYSNFYVLYASHQEKRGSCCKGSISSVKYAIQIILQATGASWVSFGWRPADLPESCKMMPAIDEISAKTHVWDELSQFKLEKKETPYVTSFIFHPHRCTDVVIGATHGMHSRIRDYYNRDLATPSLDTIYGGKEDLTGATGWEKDGMTTIIFRGKIKTNDATNHAISGKMHFIWAKGQQVGETTETEKFYTLDELKYHGHGKEHWGVLNMELP